MALDAAGFTGFATGHAAELNALAAGEAGKLFRAEVDPKRAAFVVEKIREDLRHVDGFETGAPAFECRHRQCHGADVDRGFGRGDGDGGVTVLRGGENGSSEAQEDEYPAREHGAKRAPRVVSGNCSFALRGGVGRRVLAVSYGQIFTSHLGRTFHHRPRRIDA